MTFLDMFFHRKRDEAAELRDALIVAETQVLLLRDIVEHIPQKPVREVRKDAGKYREEAAKRLAELVAYAATVKSLSAPVKKEEDA